MTSYLLQLASLFLLSFTTTTRRCDSFVLRPTTKTLSRTTSKIISLPFHETAHFASFSTSDDLNDDDDYYPSFSPGMPMMEDDDDEEDEERLSDEELMATISDWDPTVPTMNTVHLTGRIGNDPIPKYFEDGKVVVNLSFATKRKYQWQERQYLNIKNGDEETDWYGLEIWGQTAEYVSRFVDKGMQVGVIGSLQENRWTDRETGEPRNQYRIIVRDFDILETRAASELRRRSSSGGGGGGGSNNYYYNNNNQRRRSGFSTSDDDDGPSYGDGPSSAGSGGFFDM